MNRDVITKIDEEILKVCELLKPLEKLDSETYTEAVKNLQILTAERAKLEKIMNEDDVERMRVSCEYEFKGNELEQKHRQMIIDAAKVLLTAVVSIGAGIKWYTDMKSSQERLAFDKEQFAWKKEFSTACLQMEKDGTLVLPETKLAMKDMLD